MSSESASQGKETLAFVANMQSIAIDSKSPFYLHPSDHPSLVLVTQILSESGENYFTWRSSFLNALQSKNKNGFEDGMIQKPDVNSRNFQPWIQCNAIVKSWLFNVVCKELQAAATQSETSTDIWCDFEERFTQGIAPRVYELRRTMAPLQQEKSTTSTYYGRMKSVWSELQNLRPTLTCTCEAGHKMEEMREEEKVFDFLMSLDDAYATVRSQILSIEQLPSLGRAYALVAQDEKQRSVAAALVPTVEATTLLPRSTTSSGQHGERTDRKGQCRCERTRRKNK